MHSYSEASDVFSFGVLLYEIMARRAPWRGHYKMDVVVLVCKVYDLRLFRVLATYHDMHFPTDCSLSNLNVLKHLERPLI